MNSSLKFAVPNINLEEVSALNHNRSITFVNTFISRTSDFLNRYASKAEENLSAQTLEMQKLEIAINIIEEKLASIPSLKDFKGATVVEQENNSSTENKSVQSEDPKPSDTFVEEKDANTNIVSTQPVEENFIKVKDDVRYSKYFKMVNIGVPKMAVENKMRLEGLNPDLLDTPDAPCPEEEAVSDFSGDDSGSTASGFSD